MKKLLIMSGFSDEHCDVTPMFMVVIDAIFCREMLEYIAEMVETVKRHPDLYTMTFWAYIGQWINMDVLDDSVPGVYDLQEFFKQESRALELDSDLTRYLLGSTADDAHVRAECPTMCVSKDGIHFKAYIKNTHFTMESIRLGVDELKSLAAELKGE